MERTLHDTLLGAPQPNGHWRACFLEPEGRTAPGTCRYPEIKASCRVMSGYRAWFPQPTVDR